MSTRRTTFFFHGLSLMKNTLHSLSTKGHRLGVWNWEKYSFLCGHNSWKPINSQMFYQRTLPWLLAISSFRLSKFVGFVSSYYGHGTDFTEQGGKWIQIGNIAHWEHPIANVVFQFVSMSTAFVFWSTTRISDSYSPD